MNAQIARSGMAGRPSPKQIRVLVVDDHPLLRTGVAALIASQADMQVVGEAVSGGSAVEMAGRLGPDIVLMDLRMPDMDGVEATAAIRAALPGTRVMVFTTYSGDVLATRALDAGASAYMLKTTAPETLLDTIRKVHAGRRHLHPQVANQIAEHAVGEALSEREIEVLRHVANGRTNQQIGATLGVSEHAIKARLKNVFAKLNVTDRAEAVVQAARRGIIDI